MAAPPQPGAAPEPEGRQARDVMAFGQETGRALSDGRIVGRAEPFAKVFPSSRVVKRAVGLVAWAVLEDIALDARIDDAGRLVSETNVRRIAANLGISKNTVTQHLATLREYGFVFREEVRERDSGRYEVTRYVLDPSACIERFTVTPGADDQSSGPSETTAPSRSTGARADASPPTARQPESDRDPHPDAGSTLQQAAASRHNGSGQQPRPNIWDTDRSPPRPKNRDTGAMSHVTGHRDLGQNNKEVVVEEQQQQQPRAGARETAPSTLAEQMVAVGVAPDLAESLAVRYPPERVAAAVRAADREGVRSPSGFVVSALRDGWDLSEAIAAERAAQQRQRREAEQAAADTAARSAQARERARADGWSAAISAALGDRDLARAVATVAQPVAGIGRRSVPMARAELIRWAVTVASREPDRPLRDALLADLARGPTRLEPHADVDLPDPPAAPTHAVADLSARITACPSARDFPNSSSERGAEL